MLHIIGAGLAGLSCALAAVDRGLRVMVHEAAGRAGGRCRSWHEPSLGAVIDNGSHLVVGANRAVFGFLDRVGARDGLVKGPAAFTMLDLATGQRWRASPARLLPTILASSWRLRRGADSSIERRLGVSRQFRRFWEPVALAIMNTPADAASVQVFRRVVARTLWRGQRASQSFLVRNGLSETFVEPALAALARKGATVRLHHPLRHIERDAGRAHALSFDDGVVPLGDDDQVVLAVSWAVAAGLIPGLPDLPESPIVNGHFRLAQPPAALPEGGILGLLGGTAQWLFLRGDIVSVTVSAAGDLAERSIGAVADLLWADIRKALDLMGEPLAVRIIKEKRATIFHTPDVEARRPLPRYSENLILAGDWTATGLPCTLEGAIVSGTTAAALVP